jgi:3-dehydroquinate synthase
MSVEEDEKETGQRVLLNLGHTFAHALESYTHYRRWLHGEAVGIGLYCAAQLSYQMGYLDRTQLEFIDSLLEKAQLPRRIPKDMDIKKLQGLMSQDKKVKNKTLHFVVIRKPGDCYLDNKVSDHLLHNVLMAAVKGDDE